MMNEDKHVQIIDTGGTFNKIYNKTNGELEVDATSIALNDIKNRWMADLDIVSIIGKDSLDMTEVDRVQLAEAIDASNKNKIVVVHGTDTMHITAQFLAEKVRNKTIVLTGAMVPYSIDCVEATANLALALGSIHSISDHSVYISMNGLFGKYDDVHKNKVLGRFVY
jgi:L-asparaginase